MGTSNDDYREIFRKERRKWKEALKIEAFEVSNNRKSFEGKLLRSSSFEIKNIYNKRGTKFLKRSIRFNKIGRIFDQKHI